MTLEDHDSDRYPPRRHIGKREGVRHVLHAAIRDVFSGEDPFAVHVLAQSAEKVLIDLLKSSEIEDPLRALIKPEMRVKFFRVYRESYNFLKHADRDSDGNLAVYDIVGSNDLILFSCAIRYQLLFGDVTKHMWMILIFTGLFYPGIVDWDRLPQLKGPIVQLATTDPTRGELISNMRIAMQQDSDWERELEEDLGEVRSANGSKAGRGDERK